MGAETIEKINPAAIQAGVKGKGFKAASFDSAFGGAMLDAANAMAPAGATAAQMYSGVNSQTVLGAAFSGMGQTAAMYGGGASGASFGGGGGTPYMAAGYGGGFKATGSAGGVGSLNPGEPVPGMPGLSTPELLETMNQNNLQLLELQATMQNNMQGWNTKSNILSADHRARMAMIEKFSARG